MFKKYNSIENSYREKEVERIANRFGGEVFCCTEKVHGANFSFIVEGDDVKVAKRSGLIQENENFYAAKEMLEKYRENALCVRNKVGKDVIIYGEHFGGCYNGECNGVKIQKEVEYIPFNDFIAFDIYIPENEEYLPYKEAEAILKECKFKVVPLLKVGSLEECLNHPNDELTKVPEIYGLEPIENNIMEGTVIKLYEIADRLPNGDRPILKNKNDKFKEKGKVKKRNKQTVAKLTDKERQYVEEISRYFEDTRIENLLSKGEVKLDWKEFGKIAGLFFKDALEDFLKDNPEFTELDKKVRKAITNLASNEAKAFIREFLKRNI